MAEIESGVDLYEMNKLLIKQNDKPLSNMGLHNALHMVDDYIADNVSLGVHYFMMLCKELSNYTIFNIKSDDIVHIKKQFHSDIKECLDNRGKVYAINKTEDNFAIEIWVNDFDSDEMNCYMLFPYDLGVIEI